ncbi:MAG: TonB-dependent receptor [Bacteroidetes bacterium]|nr:TonB-dependent receptor [Bacteroidota bacterium]
MKPFGTLLLLLVLVPPMLAQDLSVGGRVLQADGGAPLPNANVLLRRLPDSSTAGGAVTGRDGRFLLDGLRRGRYVLTISYVGYDPVVRDVPLRGESAALGDIRLQERSVKLDAVEVTGTAPIAVMKEDTTEFLASAFKVNPDATAEDLVRKMPGVTVKDGKVEAQGEEVKAFRVDGRPFFGDDARTLLRNLPAEVISRIQVYDQQSEKARFTGFSDGNEVKAMNFITRDAIRNAQFGKIYGGYGEENHYRAGAILNAFAGKQRWSLMAMSNDVNEQNFSQEDLLGVMLSASGPGGMRGMRGGGGGGQRPPTGGMPNFNAGSISDFLVNAGSGIAQTNAVGLNYIDTWFDKVEVSGSYFFNQSDLEAGSGVTREFVLPQTAGQFYDETSAANTDNMNHRFNMRLDWKIDTLNSILWRPRFSAQLNEGFERTMAGTSTAAGRINSSNSDFHSDLTGLSFSNELLWRRRFATRGRTFSLEIENDVKRNSGENRLFYDYASYGMQSAFDTTSQRSDLLASGWTAEATATYTEPVGERGQLQLRHRAAFSRDESDKRTWELPMLAGMAETLDPLQSNEFSTDYLTQNASVGFRYENDNINGMVGLGYQWATLDNEQVYPTATAIDRRYGDVIPFAMLRYKFTQGKDLRVFYRTRTSPPSVTRLQDVLDNSNPLLLSIGNPELEQETMQFVGMRYSAANLAAGNYFFLFAMGSYTFDAIGNHTIVAGSDTTVFGGIPLLRGTQITRPENFDGSYALRSFMTYGQSVGFLKSNLNLNLSGTFSRTPGLINGTINYASSPMAGLGVSLSSNISPDLDFTISTQTSLTWIQNSVRENGDTRYQTQSSRLRLNWIFLEDFVFGTDLAHEYYRGLSEGYNDDFLLWNMSLGYKFLPDNAGELRLTVFDLLKQNNSISRTVTDTYIEDTRTNLLQRYVLLTFTWSLRNFKI